MRVVIDPVKPINAPMTPASLISPPPIPPRDIIAVPRNIPANMTDPRAADLIPSVNGDRQSPIIIPGYVIRSGIIPSLRSVKDTIIKMDVNIHPASVAIKVPALT